MNRRSLLGATAMTAVGVVMSPSHTLGQQQSLKERLLGTLNRPGFPGDRFS